MERLLTTDEQLVERAIAGDADAFGEVVRRWERKIYALAYGFTGSVEDARDAAQETFVAAYRNLQNFRGEAKVSSWLHRIAVNQCITRQRRARVRAETGIEDAVESAGESFLSAGEQASPARAAEAKERTEAVRRAVAALTPELREVVLLKEFEGLTFQEIADALQVPLSTVKSRLYTALRQLRMRLEKFELEVAPR
ncbi:MAG TPA: sigma-70 family RNA polymerase sigma factor [Pyrinomonadaceae bacterium]|nr:sigma-70 family RNA polymerase sigma factor [Pyrinomonadaceae bacterium]